mgnify:CR=1 FL=1
MKILIDRNIYSDECISKCVYSLSGILQCNRQLNGDLESVELNPTNGGLSDADVERLFLQRLNDYKLRQIVFQETKDIRTILYAKAFSDYDDFLLEDAE